MSSAKRWFIALSFIVFCLQYHRGTCRFSVKKVLKRHVSRNISVDGDEILLNGKGLRILSGEMHYFRVPARYWRDRLQKMKIAGLNAVSTYVEWSYHEQEPRKYMFSVDRDLGYFMRIARSLRMYVLLKPGPFICADRDLGGLPYWLLSQYPNIKLRTPDADFIREVKFWMKRLFSEIDKYLYGKGGPIIMVQVESQYGSEKRNKLYMRSIRDVIKSYVGDDALLYTSDTADRYRDGSVEGALPTLSLHATEFVSGVNSVSESLERMYSFTKKGPLIISDLYVGWMTIWGPPYTPAYSIQSISNLFKEIMSCNHTVHINFYMFCGGTNFEFSSGAQVDSGFYLPVATSYNYDAPLNQAGDPTPKYVALRNAIIKYRPKVANQPLPKVSQKGEYGRVVLKPCLYLLSAKGRKRLGTRFADVTGPTLPTFEELKQRSGLMLYETDVKATSTSTVSLNIAKPRDRTYVYVNRHLLGVMSRITNETEVKVYPTEKPSVTLSLLTENMGRLSPKNDMDADRKGILSPVQWDTTTLSGTWEVTGYNLMKKEKALCELVNRDNFKNTLNNGPILYIGKFQIPHGFIPRDTYFYPTGWGKGYVWINGRSLGRYWPSAGPQTTLYVPGVWLRAAPALNRLRMLELERAPPNLTVEFIKYDISF